MFNNTQELFDMLPVVIVAAGILISVFVEIYSERRMKILPWLSIIIFLAAGFHAIYYTGNKSVILQNMLATGGVTNIFWFIFNIGAAIVCLLSINYIKKYGTYFGEYYIIIQTSVLGMMLIAGAKDLIVIFLGLEIMSISFYVLAGFNRKRASSNEASLKYFLLGAFATGFLVYGMALIYGSSATTSIDTISANFIPLSGNLLFITGVMLFIIGFSFKIAAFPFHMWVPDVYQGSPTTITGLFSTVGKAAGFSALIVTFAALFGGSSSHLFTPYLAAIAVFSMLYGSIVAIMQDNIKRMLAYSSIAHAGYMIIGLAAGNSSGVAGIIFYLTAYVFMNLAAFGIVSIIEGKDESNLSLSSYAGLSNRSPLLAGLLAVTMFALAGIPPLAGFFGKYYVFIAAIKANLTWLAIVGIVASTISVYFYIRIVVLMYFKPSESEFIPSYSATEIIAVLISVLVVILLGLAPGSFIDLITSFL
ncbi:NADH-quinone oxidoreductase subunit N [bacterium BMS3Abin03]|nr:NADH-quinone oxidoreductase subunit N [bacterium BMS3Abin03]